MSSISPATHTLSYRCFDRLDPLLRPNSVADKVPLQLDDEGRPQTAQNGGTPAPAAHGMIRLEIHQSKSDQTANAFAVFQQPLRLEVISERLAPPEVVFRYPPPESQGDYSHVLPHLSLKSAILPWERFAQTDVKTGEETKAAPWLALLVFKDGAPKIIEGTLQDLIKAEPARFQQEPHEQAGTACRYIQLTAEMARKMIPSAAELQQHAHVQEVSASTPPAHAAVIISKLPVQGEDEGKGEVAYTAFLVSVEKMFPLAEPRACHLIVLDSWSFTHMPVAEGLKKGAFATRMSNVEVIFKVPHEDFDWARPLEVPDKPRKVWYKGPFSSAPLDQDHASLSFPLRESEEAVLLSVKNELYVAYAAAWELGRLIALHDKELGIGLSQWRIARRERTDLPLPPATRERLAQLKLLQGVPQHYLLVPELQLRPEQMRLFHVDSLWVSALMDGAFSLGRHTGKDHERDIIYRRAAGKAALKDKENPLHEDARLFEPVEMSGLLLRSSAVHDWPRLDISVGTANLQKKDEDLPALRQERLSQDTLLCLLPGRPRFLNICLPPDLPHFEAPTGVENNGTENNGAAFALKRLKTPEGIQLAQEYSTLTHG